MNWALVGNTYHCSRPGHTETWERGERSCLKCAAGDAGSGPVTVEAQETDLEAHAVEEGMLLLARRVERIANGLDEGTTMEQALATKYYDTHFKAIRIWADLHAKRVDVERNERTVATAVKISGVRGTKGSRGRN